MRRNESQWESVCADESGGARAGLMNSGWHTDQNTSHESNVVKHKQEKTAWHFL